MTSRKAQKGRIISSITIEGRKIGPASPMLIIGEVGMAHDGNLALAHEYLEAIADASADAVKFQTHIAEAESTPEEPFRIPMGSQDVSRLEYWKRTGFSFDQWQGLAQHTRDLGLIFLSSPFSEAAVDLLESLDVPAYKVASGEVGNTLLIDRLLATGRPLLLSSGMSSLAEIDQLTERINEEAREFGVMQCTSLYPTPAEKIGLNLMEEYRQRYGCPVGLSDHSGKIYAGLAATALGCDMLEAHITLSRQMPGPDVDASLTAADFAQLVQGAREIESMLASPVEKDLMSLELEPMREIFFHSIVASMDLPAGTVINRQHLAARKPGTGLSTDRIEEFLGRKLVRSVARNQLLREEDFE